MGENHPQVGVLALKIANLFLQLKDYDNTQIYIKIS